MPVQPLPGIAALLLCTPIGFVQAQARLPETGRTASLVPVIVTASPLRASAEDFAAPVEVLAGETLERSKRATLGQTLASLPGIQSADFGVGVSRPILRGLEGPRVQVLSGGLATFDVSTVSADHAVSVEPFLADQIEVLKGPATLLFGSGAIGGAVNVVDGRIAPDLPDRALGGRAEARAGSGSDERTGMFRLDGVSGGWVLHFDGLVRNADDVEIPGTARLESREHDHDEGEAQAFGLLPNSALKTRAGGFGATFFGERGRFGAAVSSYRNNYGIPDGAHVHDEGDHDHAPGEDEHGFGEGRVRIDLEQDRQELRGGLDQPAPFLERLDLRLASSRYSHSEYEDGRIGTVFDNRGFEGRIEAVPHGIGKWRGAFGLQFGQSRFRAEGEEAFVPATRTGTLGAFALQQRDFDPVRIELGARYDRVALDPDAPVSARRFDLGSLSGSAIWRLDPRIELRLGLDHSERAPVSQELHAAGLHAATRSLEIGDASLHAERANRIELGLHAHTDRVTLKAALYETRFAGFIHQADTGIEVHDAPVRLWTQHDAAFHGAEAEASLPLLDEDSGQLELRLMADLVRARLDGHGRREVAFTLPHGDHAHEHTASISSEGQLPRIAPARLGTRLSWTSGGLEASAGALRHFAQDRVAEHEQPSPGYTLIDAHLAYRWDLPEASWEAFLEGSNLGNREARPHTSLLRDLAPLPGRSLAVGLRVHF